MNKICVIGASGNIGNEIFEHLKSTEDCEVIGTCYQDKSNSLLTELDVLNKDQVRHFLDKVQPDKIIFVHGLKDVKNCEENIDLSFQINANSLKNFLEFNGEIIYVSTDYVFDGEKGNYKEEDVRHPKTQYGMSKKAGEDIILTHKKGSIIRSGGILTSSGVYLQWLRSNIKQQKQTSGYVNVFFTPTPIKQFLLALDDLIQCNSKKIIHVSGPKVSRYELLCTIYKIFGLGDDLVKGEIIRDFKQSLFQKDLSLISSYKFRIEREYFFDCLQELIEN